MQMWKLGQRTVVSTFKDFSVMMNNFDAAHKLMNIGQPNVEEKHETFRSKQDLFFIDHEFVPLLVQESYLNSFGTDRTELEDLEKMAEAADFISMGDLINVKIRRDQNWSLLPDYGTMSSVAPCLAIQGRLTFPAFPQYLGKYSRARKSRRLLRELSQSIPCSIGRTGLLLELVPFLLKQILLFLGRGLIDDIVEFLDDLKITNEMFKEHLICLSMDDNLVKKFEGTDPQLKAALTREYNKEHKEITKLTKRGAGKGAKGSVPDPEEDAEAEADSDSGGEEGQLLDEIQLEEIKKAKKQEKEMKRAQLAMKRLAKIQEFQAIERIDAPAEDDTKGRGRAKRTTKSQAKKKAPAKGRGKRKN